MFHVYHVVTAVNLFILAFPDSVLFIVCSLHSERGCRRSLVKF